MMDYDNLLTMARVLCDYKMTYAGEDANRQMRAIYADETLSNQAKYEQLCDLIYQEDVRLNHLDK